MHVTVTLNMSSPTTLNTAYKNNCVVLQANYFTESSIISKITVPLVHR